MLGEGHSSRTSGISSHTMFHLRVFAEWWMCTRRVQPSPSLSQRTSFSALLWLPSYPGVWLQSLHYLYCLWIKVCAQSCLTLCNPMNCSLPGSFCPWDFPGSGLPCLLSGDLPDPGLKPMSFVSPALAGRFFTTALSGKPPMNTGTYYSPSLSKVCLRARKQLMWTVWEPGLGPHSGWFSNPCL